MLFKRQRRKIPDAYAYHVVCGIHVSSPGLPSDSNRLSKSVSTPRNRLGQESHWNFNILSVSRLYNIYEVFSLKFLGLSRIFEWSGVNSL